MSTKSAETPHPVLSKLDWIKQDADENAHILPIHVEKKLHTQIMESRFAPLGCFATAGALIYGLYTVKPEDSGKVAQVLTKYKAAAQGLTAAALLGGVLLTAMQLEKTEKTEKKETEKKEKSL